MFGGDNLRSQATKVSPVLNEVAYMERVLAKLGYFGYRMYFAPVIPSDKPE